MKSHFPLILIACFLIIGCTPKTTNTKVGVLGEADCVLQKLTYKYENMEVKFELNYDDNFKIVDSKKYVNGDLERSSFYEYNDKGALTQSKVYMQDTLTETLILDHAGDSIIFSLLGEKHKVLYLHLNNSKEIIKIAEYVEDSVGLLFPYGSGYINTWVNGNLESIANWVVKTDSLGEQIVADNAIKRMSELINSDALIYNERVFYKDREVERFYITNIEYDDKINPLRHISLATVLFPSDYNTSVNNPVKMTRNYNSGEVVTFIASYEYNDSNYPVKANVKATYASEHEEGFDTDIEVLFEYKNR